MNNDPLTYKIEELLLLVRELAGEVRLLRQAVEGHPALAQTKQAPPPVEVSADDKVSTSRLNDRLHLLAVARSGQASKAST